MIATRVDPTHALPVQRATPPKACELITQVAIKILKEFAVAVAVGVGVAYFIASPSGIMLMMSAAVVQLAVSAFFHFLGIFASYQSGNLYKTVATLCEWVTGVNFSVSTGFNGQILIHESGHALASLLMYKRPRPTISIAPFSGGETQFFKTALTPFGQKLGPAGATCFVVASGPALTLFISTILLAIGIKILEKHPEMGKYLISWAGMDFINHAIYAYSAIGAKTWNLKNDFVHLSIFGLNPAIATIALFTIPILTSLGVHYLKRKGV